MCQKHLCTSKKELLSSLLASLLEDLSEDEKKKMLQSVMRGGRQNRETIEMVEQ